MRTTAIKITPEDYILSVLTPEERLDAALSGNPDFESVRWEPD